MTLRLHGLLLACFALTALTDTSRALAQVLSPGPLSEVHKALEGDDHCLQCHSSGKRVDTQLCNKCHADIGHEVQTSSGLHGHEYRSKPCSECHVEHRGVQHDLVRWPSGSRDKFDHRLTGWLLAGQHSQVACMKCHTAKNTRGSRTFLNLSTTCNGCHKDPHEKRLGTECQKCHSEQSWKTTSLSSFDHSLTRFPLRGKHHDVECKSCHGSPPDTKYHPIAFESCTNCHKDPHQGRLSQNCTSCHSEAKWSEVRMQRDSHPGLSLGAGHSSVQCKTCHDRGLDHEPSKGSRCVSCHAPIHEAPFGNDCAHCHKRIEWLGVSDALALDVHGKTAFPLRGEHVQVQCERCHSPKLPVDQRFKKLKFAHCLNCHADAHAGEFSTREGGDCAGCHDEHGFAPTRFGVDAHALTVFPLLGRHAAVACVGCHKAANVAPATAAPARSGRAAPVSSHPARLDWHVTGQRCADCHDNPHGEQFAKEMAQGGCAQCHTPNAWNLPNVDHGTWPLTGAHALTQCGSCHEMQDGKLSANYRGVARECEGCHDDPHAGQFRLQPPLRKCADCHGTQSFSLPNFDHTEKTTYVLDGAHQKVACTGCHRSETLHNGGSAVRYRLTYRACADCHSNPHTQEAP